MQDIELEYTNSNIENKRLLIGSIFQNKIQFENNKVRTADINPILEKIASVNREYSGIKKWDKSKKKELSHRVPGVGIEPTHLSTRV